MCESPKFKVSKQLIPHEKDKSPPRPSKWLPEPKQAVKISARDRGKFLNLKS